MVDGGRFHEALQSADWWRDLGPDEYRAVMAWVEENPAPEHKSTIQHAYDNREDIEGVSS